MATLYDFIDFSGKSANIDRWDDPGYSAFDDFPYLENPTPSLTGTMTSNVPVDIEHWVTPGGSTGTTGMEHWQSCISLMMRL